MGKKNPYITTIGFNRDDPEHIYVAELLNSIGRGKAQYIVKAVLVYQELQQKGEVQQSSFIYHDYEGIKRIVLQVIEEREKQTGNSAGIPHEVPQEPAEQKENDLLKGFDEDSLNGIWASMVAFKESIE